MRLAIIFAAVLALALCVEGQTAEAPKEPTKGSFEGTVVKDPDDEPIKKAIIEMIAENQGEGGNYTATSDAEGRFKIAEILPGRYRVVLERTGYVGIDKKKNRALGWMLSIEAGQEIKDQKLHMLAAAIVTGRVLDERGSHGKRRRIRVATKGKALEPLVRLRQTISAVSYRRPLAGKPLSAMPLPTFRRSYAQDRRRQETAASQTSYLRTFYPGSSTARKPQPSN
jgi:hypothetical protein